MLKQNKKPCVVEIIKGNAESPDISYDEADIANPDRGWVQYVKDIDNKVEKQKEHKGLSKDPSFKYGFDVDMALDSIDLTFPNYTPSRSSVEFFNIIKLVLGEDPEFDNSIMHFFLVDLIFGFVKPENFPYNKEVRDKIRINPRKIAVIASRFSAKSTVLTAYMPLYVAITGQLPNFGKVMFWVSFGDSQQAGAKVQANTIRDICEDSAFCKEYFEHMRFTDEECEFIRRGDTSKRKRAFMLKNTILLI